jgi:hypothetical protein
MGACCPQCYGSPFTFPTALVHNLTRIRLHLFTHNIGITTAITPHLTRHYTRLQYPYARRQLAKQLVYKAS